MDSEIDRRLKKIEARLDKLEGKVKSTSQAVVAASLASTPSGRNIVSQTKTSLTVPKPGSWLAIVAVICFVLAAAFIIKLSIDSGWLTPARQIGLAYLLGLCLIVAGFAILKKDRAYASFLPADGIVILYLTTFAAHQYYHLITFNAAIAITSLVSLFCIYLYLKIQHDIYPIIAAVGAYLSPILLDFHANAVFSLYYFVICSLAFATISIWLRSRILTMVAAYLAILVNSMIGVNLGADRLLAGILPIHFVIFSLSTYVFSYKTNKTLSESEAWSFFPVLVLFYAMEYYFIYQFEPRLAPWLSLAFAAFLLCLYLWAKTRFPKDMMHSEGMILAFVTLVIFHSVYMELLPVDVKPWLFVILTGALALMPNVTYNKNNMYRFQIPLLAILLILAIEYISMLFSLMIDSPSWRQTPAAFFIFIALWMFILLQRNIMTSKSEIGYGILAAAHLLAIALWYQLTTDISSLAVSASWLFYAICVMGLAYARQDKMMARSALFILSFAAAKALLYDASSAPTIVRIFCLLITGVVLYGAGFVMRRIALWR